MDPRRARVNTVKQDFVKLTLGMFATSFSSYPLTFTRGGQAEAPQGKADVLDVKGPEGSNFTARLFINSQSHQPIMLSWQMPPSNVIVTVPGQPAPKPETLAAGTVVVEGPPAPAAGASKEETDKYTKDVADVTTKSSSQAARASSLLRGLSRCRQWRDVPVQAAPRHRSRHRRGNELRRIQVQPENRSAKIRTSEVTRTQERAWPASTRGVPRPRSLAVLFKKFTTLVLALFVLSRVRDRLRPRRRSRPAMAVCS